VLEEDPNDDPKGSAEEVVEAVAGAEANGSLQEREREMSELASVGNDSYLEPKELSNENTDDEGPLFEDEGADEGKTSKDEAGAADLS
jgi:hypothetical protein